MLDDESEAFFNGPIVDQVGLPSRPEFRYKADLGMDVPFVNGLRLGLEYEYIDSYANNTTADYMPEGEVDSWEQINLRASYKVFDNVGLRLVVRNLDNSDPVFSQMVIMIGNYIITMEGLLYLVLVSITN